MALAKKSRRALSTIEALLASATRLFGERGYADTSLEDIALDCGLTIGAIYHHFGNKKALFSAVNEAAEQRIIHAGNKLDDDDPTQLMQKRWRAFLALCDEPGFRRIVLVDSPHILGRDRWANSEVSAGVTAPLVNGRGDSRRQELTLRILRGAMAEAALALAEADNNRATRLLVNDIVEDLMAAAGAQLQTITDAKGK
jgi:AcrR family transcriptional regulator